MFRVTVSIMILRTEKDNKQPQADGRGDLLLILEALIKLIDVGVNFTRLLGVLYDLSEKLRTEHIVGEGRTTMCFSTLPL